MSEDTYYTVLAESAVPDGFYTAFPCLDARDAVSPIDGKPCRREQSTTAVPAATETKPSTRLTAPRWFYVTPNGIHALGGEPNDDSCGRIDAKDAAACVASLRFCPQGGGRETASRTPSGERATLIRLGWRSRCRFGVSGSSREPRVASIESLASSSQPGSATGRLEPKA